MSFLKGFPRKYLPTSCPGTDKYRQSPLQRFCPDNIPGSRTICPLPSRSWHPEYRTWKHSRQPSLQKRHPLLHPILHKISQADHRYNQSIWLSWRTRKMKLASTRGLSPYPDSRSRHKCRYSPAVSLSGTWQEGYVCKELSFRYIAVF